MKFIFSVLSAILAIIMGPLAVPIMIFMIIWDIINVFETIVG